MNERAATWRRSSYCANGACVEVSLSADEVWVRDSKVIGSPILAFGPAAWTAFIAGVRADDFQS